MKETEVLTVQQQEIQPSNILQAVMQLARDPEARIDVIERMFALQERLEGRQREQIFMSALSQLQADCPMIHRGGKNTHTGTTYARREDIQAVIGPLLAKHGFAMSFDEESADLTARTVTFTAKLSHKDGHFEIKRKTVPIDESAKNRETGKAVRTGIQDSGSTASYAFRYLIKMHLNIAETDEDTDGAPTERVTPDQAKDLEIAAKDAGLNIPKFFVFMKVGGWDEILAADLKKAINAIEVRRQENAKAAK